jgi:hypothetical protein
MMPTISSYGNGTMVRIKSSFSLIWEAIDLLFLVPKIIKSYQFLMTAMEQDLKVPVDKVKTSINTGS